jgi:hypothetical protein
MVHDYLQQSKVLLIGIANLQPREGEQIELAVERTAARDLVRRARLLYSQPIDDRSQELVQELERILIELANMELSADLPNVELIRGGIRKQNLLFKIRMAETRLEQEDQFKY